MEVFNYLAYHYKYTFADIGAMTIRQVWACIEAIQIQKHNNFSEAAALQGKKITPKKFQQEFEDLSEEQKELMKRAIKEATQRKLEEMSKINERKGR